MEDNKKNPEVIDIVQVVKTISGRKKLFYKIWAITFVLSCALILPVPRSYTSVLTLAPELGGESAGGGLASLASSFGFNMGNLESSDAFYPELYPDVISTNTFIVDLFDIRVKTLDGTIDTDYYTYLKKHQKQTIYMVPINWVRKQIKNLLSPKEERPGRGTGKINPFLLSEDDNNLVAKIRKSISCSVDKKNFVITISVIDQDPLISATMADSVRVRLQDFITTYRTSKARVDMDYYKVLKDSTQIEYQKALSAYNRYVDAHKNSVLQSFLSGRDELENEVSLRLQAYTAMNTQYEAAKAKVQERTPAFTVLKAASVPIKPDHPKRMIFVAAMLFLATFGTGVYLLRKLLFDLLLSAR